MENLILSAARKEALDTGFRKAFGYLPQRYFSAPGRTELSGNHTDHQNGRVLAAAVDLDMQAAVCVNEINKIRVLSQGYPLCVVELDQLTPQLQECNTTAALIRGVAARFTQLGCKVRGFDAYVESAVLPGSGLSSSAAFEVLIATVINHLFFEKKASPPQIAMIGQYAENVFFGKPCGLMDQMASAVGGLVAIDFADKDNPVITPVSFDFRACGYALCIIDTGASHAELTDEYGAITRELRDISGFFGKDVLRDVEEVDFYRQVPALRQQFGDRAVLRAIHFFAENARVEKQVEALAAGNFADYLNLMNQSGRYSFMYLQNVVPAGATVHQEVAMALALCQRLLEDRGASRVHGGGFAGTVQAFVPLDLLPQFQRGIDEVFGKGACHVLSVRSQGGVELLPEEK